MTALSPVEFRHFAPGDETAFRELNHAWIARHFEVEEKDLEVLNDPVTYILRPGGALLMAVEDGVAIGTCALLPMGDGAFEVAKMTVSETHRGLGLGKQLLAHVIEYARGTGAKRLYLETNRKLETAIHVYESLGFRHLPLDRVKPSPYARANVYMELWLG
ncbi:MAG TPA: GNAT family N-acetyltransferase [Bryobacteraceae bacterium]|jgi:putative acetyltransferase|nr:GNAT family N-acetyltransferase [Bryobacteraceae bacterium]